MNSNFFTLRIEVYIRYSFTSLKLLLKLSYALAIWMTQWGSKTLGDQGYNPIELLRNFYGDNMYINTAEEVSGVPSSWPGFVLSIGTTGDAVTTIQDQLNRIAQNYPLIQEIDVDGIYGEATANALRTFQEIFDLPQSGVVDYATWFKISAIYVAVSRIAELV